MKRRTQLAGCTLAWLVTAVLSAAEVLLVYTCLYDGRYAAESMYAAEDSSTAGWLAVFLLPLFLIVLFGAVYLTICCTDKRDSGQRPGEER